MRIVGGSRSAVKRQRAGPGIEQNCAYETARARSLPIPSPGRGSTLTTPITRLTRTQYNGAALLPVTLTSHV